jgi:putative transposase
MRLNALGEMVGERKVQSNSLGAIIRSFKSVVTKRARELNLTSEVWQRNYDEHIIRGEHDLNAIREYIMNNPLKWELDEYYFEVSID